ncbi:hypothetical protein V6N12_004486 [Hibiscus sabdariffa]|uniref:Uncharacterized protein n=1 Tax=Hibiscus sabdariffa TaxID=183260 RepID=A0ABR2CMD3_9ROSI
MDWLVAKPLKQWVKRWNERQIMDNKTNIDLTKGESESKASSTTNPQPTLYPDFPETAPNISENPHVDPELFALLPYFYSLESEYDDMLKTYFPDLYFGDPVGVASESKKKLPTEKLPVDGKKKFPAHVKMDYQTPEEFLSALLKHFNIPELPNSLKTPPANLKYEDIPPIPFHVPLRLEL